MSESNIRPSIESRLNAWASTRSPVLRIAWQNVPFKPESGEVYLKSWLMPGNTSSDDLEGKMRTHVGVYQISIVTPINLGTGLAAGIADELEILFPVNLRMVFNGDITMVLTPVSVASLLQNVQEAITPVSFSYRLDTI